MGTSTSNPGSPNWSPVKSATTQALGDGTPDSEEAADLVSQFVDQLCNDGDPGLGELPDDITQIDVNTAIEKVDKLIDKFPSTPKPSKGGRSSSDGPGGGGGGGGAASPSGSGRRGRRSSFRRSYFDPW